VFQFVSSGLFIDNISNNVLEKSENVRGQLIVKFLYVMLMTKITKTFRENGEIPTPEPNRGPPEYIEKIDISHFCGIRNYVSSHVSSSIEHQIN
jgi:hypothetical protein